MVYGVGTLLQGDQLRLLLVLVDESQYVFLDLLDEFQSLLTGTDWKNVLQNRGLLLEQLLGEEVQVLPVMSLVLEERKRTLFLFEVFGQEKKSGDLSQEQMLFEGGVVENSNEIDETEHLQADDVGRSGALEESEFLLVEQLEEGSLVVDAGFVFGVELDFLEQKLHYIFDFGLLKQSVYLIVKVVAKTLEQLVIREPLENVAFNIFYFLKN